MRIRLKMKHIFLGLISLVVVYFSFSYILYPKWILYTIGSGTEGKRDVEKQQIFDLLQRPLLEGDRWKIIQEYMLNSGVGDRFDVYVGPSHTSYSPRAGTVLFSWEEKLPFLQEYVDMGPVNGYLGSAATQLSHYYQRNNDLDSADRILEKAITRFVKESRYKGNAKELWFKRIDILLKYGDYERAHEILKELEKDKYIRKDHYYDADKASVEAEILLNKGKYKEAFEHVKSAKLLLENEIQKEETKVREQGIDKSFAVSLSSERLSRLYQRLKGINKEGIDSLGKVSGKLQYKDGTPVVGAGIYLRDQELANQSVSDRELYQVITQKDGRFSIKGVIPGTYQLNLGLTLEQIDGWTWPVSPGEWIDVKGEDEVDLSIKLNPLIEITSPVNEESITEKVVFFEWDNVERASYYTLNIGMEIENGWISGSLKSNITSTSINIPIEELYAKETGRSYGNDESLDPKSILGYSNPENRFSWSVEAYDENGDIISRSNGYRLNEKTLGNLPFFYLKERKLTVADELLLNREYAKALNLYKQNIKKDPSDVHSLRMITRLIGVVKKGEGESSLPYLEMLAEINPTENIIFKIVMNYYKEEDWEGFNHWFDKYIQVVNDDLNEYTHSIYATSLMKQKDFNIARHNFKLAVDKDRNNRFIGSLLALELYLDSSIEDVIDLAHEYPERNYGDEVPDWIKLTESLKIVLQHQDAKYKYDQMFLYLIEGNEKELNKLISDTMYPEINNFIKEVRKIR